MNIQELRKDFPILDSEINAKRLVYLDSAATSQKPISVIDTMRDFMLYSNGTVRRGVYDLSVKSTQAFDDTRIELAKFINAASPNEIIFTRGTTEAINLVASSFTEMLRMENETGEILLSTIEHHANIVPWQLNAKKINAEIKVIPILDSGDLDLDAYDKLISSGKVKILALTHIANSIGTINPIKEIIAIAHQHQVPVLIDGAQGITHSIVDVQDLDADFYVFSGHKLYGPTGVGVLYAKSKFLDAMPPYHGGGEMIEKVSFKQTTYAQAPFKFEAGTPPITEVIGLGAAIKYINNAGMQNIIDYENSLRDYALSKCTEIEGLKIIGNPKNRAGIISFVFDDIGSFDIGTMLNEAGIAIRTGHHCAQPTMARFGIDSSSRISIAFYNNQEDIDLCFSALKRTVRLFRGA